MGNCRDFIALAVALLDEKLAGLKLVSAALIITGIGLPYMLSLRSAASKPSSA
jgi:hypothetical protein